MKQLLIVVFYFSIVGAILTSCHNNNRMFINADYSSVDTICYDYEKNEFEIPRDSVFGNIRYIVLETTDENLIGLVEQVFFCDSTIIVVDGRVSKGVFMFDYNGKYIGQISALGNGHHEYRELSYVCKRPDNRIVIVDEFTEVMMVFDERGQFIESSRNLMFLSAMEYVDMDHIAYNIYRIYSPNDDTYGRMSFVVKGLDNKDKYQFGSHNFTEEKIFTRYYNLYSFDGKVYCNVNFQDYIFELGVDSVKAKYRLEFGPQNVTHYHYNSIYDYKRLHYLYPYYNGEFIELDDYTYVVFRGEEGRELIYDHASKRTYALSFGFNKPMTAFFRRPIARYGDNTIVCAISITELFVSRGSMDKDDELEQLCSKVTTDSNPVLFFYDVVL